MKKRELNLKIGMLLVVLLILSVVITYEHKDKRDNKEEPYKFGVESGATDIEKYQIGRASCRERV